MLKKYGRFPKSTTDAYFDEFAKVNKLEDDNKVQKELYDKLMEVEATVAKANPNN